MTEKICMSDKIFIDTNLWVYLYANDSDKGKLHIIKNLVDKRFEDIVISTQVLGEFFHVLIRKGLKRKEEARQMVLDLMTNFTLIEVLQTSVIRAVDISIRDGYSYWDSLIVSSALDSNCSKLFSEDMHDGQIIEGRLKIANPFRAYKSRI